MTKKQKRPADMNKLAKSIVDIATGEAENSLNKPNPKGRAGGLVGGKARAASLSPEKRKEIAQKAANRRWESTKAAPAPKD